MIKLADFGFSTLLAGKDGSGIKIILLLIYIKKEN